MSYRDLRNFCEIMRSLGYSRPISVENFRLPNFELVADLCLWFAERYDPSCDISDNINEERDRVMFIKSICQLFLTKARIKLNPKKLYEANGFAVKELLKVASMLNKAMNVSGGDEDEMISTMDFNMNSKLSNLRQARTLANEITEAGAKLFDSLAKETDLRESREKALEFLDSFSRNLGSNTEQEYIEKCIRDLVGNQSTQMNQMNEMIERLRTDEKELESKIQKRAAELERSDKRLQGISQVRPEFLDEYEKCEQEIEKYYNMYIEKFRNLDFLEHQLDTYNEKELEKKKENEKALKKIQEKFKMEEFKIINEGNEDGNIMNEMGSTRTGFNKGGNVVGNIEGGDDDEDEDAEGEGSEDDGDEEPISIGSNDEEIEEEGSDRNY
uniref:Clusterin-associated protein 1 n=1 Tax=Euplotes harpa TaxID=151035 RepID=A0A7S3JJP9_9SPIT|mmetsp:Transcript_40531/g.46497  ORF Transcript_40531/g.46497 Transcript_40531/m.46497 type:complete len:386 (+) Transcript_40531:18-1175(+)